MHRIPLSHLLHRSVRSFSSAARPHDALVLASCAGSAARSAVSAARECIAPLGGAVDVLVTSSEQVRDLGESATRWAGVRHVYTANTHPLAEAVATTASLIASRYSYMVAPATTFGKNVLPRIAGTLDAECISEVVGVGKQSETHAEFTHPVYAGAALAQVRLSGDLRLITARTTAFEPVEDRSDDPASTSELHATPATGTRFVSHESTSSTRPDLGNTRVVVAGGRGLKTEQDFAMLDELADVLGGAVGATRAVVDGGLCPNDMQIGQTGKVVAPELYIGIGVSGAIQHLAGIKDSKVIVAVNSDAEAPIFQVADYGVVGDLFEVVPELTRQLKALPPPQS